MGQQTSTDLGEPGDEMSCFHLVQSLHELRSARKVSYIPSLSLQSRLPRVSKSSHETLILTLRSSTMRWAACLSFRAPASYKQRGWALPNVFFLFQTVIPMGAALQRVQPSASSRTLRVLMREWTTKQGKMINFNAK